MKRSPITSTSFGGGADAYFDVLEHKSKGAKKEPTSTNFEAKQPPTEKTNLVQWTTYIKEGYEEKLIEAARHYNQQRQRKKADRITHHDVLRYLIETMNIEQMLRVDLVPAKKKKV